MKFFRNVGGAINGIGGELVKGCVNASGSIVAKKFPKTGEYVKEMGHSVVHSSKSVIENTSHFADGAVNGAYGVLTKNTFRMEEGWGDIKTASVKTAKGIGGGLAFTGKSVGQTFQGVITKDEDQIVDGLKNIGKVGAVAMLGVGVVDFLIETDVGQAEELDTRNSHLDGSAHEVTGIVFEEKTVKLNDGSVYTGVFPIFDSQFDAILPEETYEMSDSVHIGIANMQLYEAIQENPNLATELGFTTEDVENLKSSVTPLGYDWHHQEEQGKLQLVNEEVHTQTGHTGGRSIWGGGTVNR